MLRRTVNFFRGSVRLEVSGAFPERFLNLCAQNGVVFWAVEWQDEHCLRLTVTRSGARRAAPLAEKVMCTAVPARTSGVPFFLGRFRRRYALLAGLALSLLAVCVFSRFVLTVDVQGNQNVSTAEILTALRRQGLRPGVYGPGLDEQQIINETLLQLPELSWMSVNLYGTRAEVLVREAVPKPELVDETVLGDVVAESGGIITHMEVLEGEAARAEGDTVVAGEVLISGNVKLEGPKYGGGVDLGWQQVRAAGRIWARTWRTLTAEIPLQVQVKELTGEEQSRWSLIFLGQRLNFWGKSGISYEQYDKINTTWTARLPSGREMPLALSRETLREYTTAAAQVDRAAAEQLLRDRLAEALALQLGDGEAVRTDYTVRERNGVLEVTLLAECREEIGRFAPWEGVQPQ